jgi:hypothetical protein
MGDRRTVYTTVHIHQHHQTYAHHNLTRSMLNSYGTNFPSLAFSMARPSFLEIDKFYSTVSNTCDSSRQPPSQKQRSHFYRSQPASLVLHAIFSAADNLYTRGPRIIPALHQSHPQALQLLAPTSTSLIQLPQVSLHEALQC